MDRVVRFSCVAAYAVVSATALAQAGSAAATPQPECRPNAIRDSIMLTAYVAVTPLDQSRHVDRTFLDGWAIAIAQHVKLAGRLDLAVFALDQTLDARRDSAGSARLSLSGLYSVMVPRAGPVHALSTVRPTLSRAVDDAMMKAIVAAAATDAFHPLPIYLDADSLALAVFVGATADSANDALIPIFRFKSPRVKIERAARPASGRGGPRYPREHVGSGYEGRVVLEFVVSAAGRAVPGTVRVERTPDAVFLQSALDYLPSMRYTPAVVAGCPVAVRVAQPFDFRSTDSPPATPTQSRAPPQHPLRAQQQHDEGVDPRDLSRPRRRPARHRATHEAARRVRQPRNPFARRIDHDQCPAAAHGDVVHSRGQWRRLGDR